MRVGGAPSRTRAGSTSAAVAKLADSYQHIDPALVGNETRVVVSELAGRRNIALRAQALGAVLSVGTREGDLLQRIKEATEHAGFQFEGADGLFEMLVRRAAPGYQSAV